MAALEHLQGFDRGNRVRDQHACHGPAREQRHDGLAHADRSLPEANNNGVLEVAEIHGLISNPQFGTASRDDPPNGFTRSDCFEPAGSDLEQSLTARPVVTEDGGIETNHERSLPLGEERTVILG